MPPKPLAELDSIDTATVLLDRSRIREYLPQRYEMEQLHAIHHLDRQEQLAVGSRDVRADEWWARGHIPGRPIFPGVLMVEAAAQLSTCLYKELTGDERFFGYGGIDGARFRGAVVPGDRLLLVAKVLEMKTRRVTFRCQGVVNGRIVFEGVIAGVAV